MNQIPVADIRHAIVNTLRNGQPVYIGYDNRDLGLTPEVKVCRAQETGDGYPPGQSLLQAETITLQIRPPVSLIRAQLVMIPDAGNIHFMGTTRFDAGMTAHGSLQGEVAIDELEQKLANETTPEGIINRLLQPTLND